MAGQHWRGEPMARVLCRRGSNPGAGAQARPHRRQHPQRVHLPEHPCRSPHPTWVLPGGSGGCTSSVRSRRAHPGLRQAASALNEYGFAARDLGDYDDAIDAHERSIALARRIGARSQEAAALNGLGLAHYYAGTSPKAEECLRQALAINQETGNARGEGNDLSNLGLALADLGRYAEAEQAYKDALSIDRRIGARRSVATTLNNLGLLMAKIGDRRRARHNFLQARDLYLELGTDHMARMVERNLRALRRWRAWRRQ